MTALTLPPHDAPSPTPAERPATLALVFTAFLRQGCTAFGGPIAHLGYFRTEFVERRRWLTDDHYASLVALCQFLPGPASSQTGMGIGLSRAGLPGALAAWLGFTLPSAVLMFLMALLAPTLLAAAGSGWLLGLKAVAVAVVIQAVWGMARSLCPDRDRQTLALMLAMVPWAVPGVHGQLLVMLAGGLWGAWRLSPQENAPSPLPLAVPRWLSWTSLGLFFGLLIGLPLLQAAMPHRSLEQFAAFYWAGSLVFGGGHVVLPLLQSAFVGPNGVSLDQFLAGYGAAQALPGPLFTFATYLGATLNGVTGALVATVGIFLPSLLLVVGALPFWADLGRHPLTNRLLQGLNAAVVGLLVAALYDPIWRVGVTNATTAAIALGAWIALVLWKQSPWRVVAGGAGLGWLSTAFP